MIGLIDANLLHPVSIIYGNANSLRLREMDPGSLLKEVIFTQMPMDAVVCNMDPVKPASGKKLLARYSWFFDSAHKLASKQCDGAIYLTRNGVDYIILVEMKSSASLLSKGRKQIDAGKAFAKYIEALLDRPIVVCTRLIYVGSPAPVGVLPRHLGFPAHRDVAVTCKNGRSFLSMSQLVG